MRIMGNTSNINIGCIHLNQCDPKKCTATKLGRLNMIRIMKRVPKSLERLRHIAQLSLLTAM